MMASQISHTNEIKRSRQRRRAVTIVAGFKCQGGVVLCADTQETSGNMKWPVEKLVAYEKEWCQIGFAGSDDGDIADMLIQRLQEGLNRRYDSIEKVRTYIRMTLQALYKNEINLLPWSEEAKTVRLLIAVRPKAQQEVTLFKALGPVLKEISAFEVIGAGEVVRYVAANLYRDDLPISQGVLLGNHLVSLAKKFVDGVSGDTHILTITAEGGVSFERSEYSQRQEHFFDGFNEALKSLMLSCPDTSIPKQEISKRLTAFAKDIKELRASYFRDIQNESLRHALSGKGQGDVYSRFPIGHTTQQGSSRAPRVRLQLSEGAQLAKALFDYADAEKRQKARPKRKSTKRTKKSTKKE
jgi:20S proteasome alpha/beta subunit